MSAGSSPGTGEVVVESRVEKLHGSPAATGTGGPGEADAVVDLIHEHTGGIAQINFLSVVVKPAGPWTESGLTENG